MTTTTNPTTDAARAELRAFGEHFDYDVSYLMHQLDDAPGAFAAFAAAQAMARRRDALPADLHAVACLAVMLHDDCGACAQLNLKMAVEQGVDRALLATVLERPDELDAPFADVYQHAREVVRGVDPDPHRAARLRKQLGPEAFGELAVTIVGARIYPALKRARGEATTCRRPTLDF